MDTQDAIERLRVAIETQVRAVGDAVARADDLVMPEWCRDWRATSSNAFCDSNAACWRERNVARRSACAKWRRSRRTSAAWRRPNAH
jgi:hypothetical protein